MRATANREPAKSSIRRPAGKAHSTSRGIPGPAHSLGPDLPMRAVVEEVAPDRAPRLHRHDLVLPGNLRLRSFHASTILSSSSRRGRGRLPRGPLFRQAPITKLLLEDGWSSFLSQAAIALPCPGTLYALAHLASEIVPEWLKQGIGWIAEVIESQSSCSWNRLEPNTVYHLEQVTSLALRTLRPDLQASGPLRKDVIRILDFLVSKGSSIAFSARDELSMIS